jgi:choline dehydrogenase-like flavoprotein
MEELRASFERQGIRAYDLPLSWSESKTDPCGDAEQFGITPAQANPAITIRTGARVRQLHTNPSGNQVKAVEAEIDGDRWLFRSHLVVLAAGAINTAALLLRSSDSRHPHGLSNGSDQVGRNLMKPQLTSILQLAARSGRGHDQRSLGVNDFYWGDQNVDFPLGHIQSGGGVLQDALFAEITSSVVVGQQIDARLWPGAAGWPLGHLVGHDGSGS